MSTLSESLVPIDIKLDDILLDPNNPRFAELGEEVDIVPDNRYGEEKIQKITYDRMKSKSFDVLELRDTIKTIGYLPMDRIVVRGWRSSGMDTTKFIVIEGNRRITALKWLMELHDSGKETFTDEQLINFKEIHALQLNDDVAPETARWILPGLRHVSGIKEWGPYQKARAVFILRETGCSPQEAAQSLGLATRGANQLWRSYLALEQMKKDEEYGEYAEPRLYSYFEEVFKRPNVREWLQWDDNERQFQKTDRLREFYTWVIGEIGEEGEPAEPKLPEAKSVRDLGRIIDDSGAMNVFRSTGGTLTRALAKYEVDHPENWRPIILSAELALASLTPDTLRKLIAEDIEIIKTMSSRIDQVLKDYEKLTSDNNV